MCWSIQNFNTLPAPPPWAISFPSIWTFKDYIVQIPATQHQNIICLDDKVSV